MDLHSGKRNFRKTLTDELIGNMTKTTPHDGTPRSSTSTGDPPTPPTQHRKHMITKVVNQKSVAFWFCRLDITHSINKDSSNHFLSIERLLDTLHTTIPTIHITHQKSGGGC